MRATRRTLLGLWLSAIVATLWAAWCWERIMGGRR